MTTRHDSHLSSGTCGVFENLKGNDMGILDAISDFAADHNLVLCGLLLLGGAFLLVFCFKTFWGTWNDKTKPPKY